MNIECRDCNKNFRTASGLSWHVERFHPELMENKGTNHRERQYSPSSAVAHFQVELDTTKRRLRELENTVFNIQAHLSSGKPDDEPK